MVPIKDGVVASIRRPPSHKTVQDAADALRRLISAIEAGELEVSSTLPA